MINCIPKFYQSIFERRKIRKTSSIGNHQFKLNLKSELSPLQSIILLKESKKVNHVNNSQWLSFLECTSTKLESDGYSHLKLVSKNCLKHEELTKLSKPKVNRETQFKVIHCFYVDKARLIQAFFHVYCNPLNLRSTKSIRFLLRNEWTLL